MPEAVRERHQDRAPDAGLEVLLGGRRPAPCRASRAEGLRGRPRRPGRSGSARSGCRGRRARSFGVADAALARSRARASRRRATRSGPSASTASAAVTAESMPPERPSTALVEAALARVVRAAPARARGAGRRPPGTSRRRRAGPPGSVDRPEVLLEAPRRAPTRRPRASKAVEAPSKTSLSLPPTRLQCTSGTPVRRAMLLHHAAAQRGSSRGCRARPRC